MALPYIQIRIDDYLRDTKFLTTEEHGAYLLLIFYYWQTERALDDTDEKLAKIVGVSKKRWKKLKINLEKYFFVENNIWTHSRIEFDLEKVIGKQKKASHAASEGVRKRENERLRQRTLQRLESERPANAERTLSHTDTDTDTDNNKNSLSDLKIELKESFELCESLSAFIVKNGGKQPNITKSWIQEMNRIITIDERSPREIKYLIEWSQKDPFWCSNILSPKSLRAKFDQLRLKSPLSGHPNPKPKVEGTPSQSSNRFEVSEQTPQPPKFSIKDVNAPTKPAKSWRELVEEAK